MGMKKPPSYYGKAAQKHWKRDDAANLYDKTTICPRHLFLLIYKKMA